MLIAIKTWIVTQKNHLKLWFLSLFYNHFCTWTYVFDTALAPLFWIVDNYSGKLGQSFVAICCVLLGCVVGICYWIGLPYWWNKSPPTTICLLIFGNYIFINCIFHYYMGIKCDPGHPPQDVFMEEVASICKKCIKPKPHRTHHCSICNTCVLLMDHHCPWLNNCVGHFNRRYFLMFMIYIVIGIIFIIIFGVEIAYQELWLNYNDVNEVPELYGYSVNVNTSLPKEDWIVNPANAEANAIISEEKYRSIRRRCVAFVGIICVGVLIAIGTLLYGHCKMISKGETSIEKHINNSERKKYKAKNEVYVNPYDFGRRKNWMIFLGIYNGSKRTWRHILLPSPHKPFGDGLVWPSINSTDTEWEEFFHRKVD
ncbi:hypothetical protein V9T40_003809 [Parthenolecanium corni]|uniref:Palmitoyltransferase n=1 Tax=Parthenolecanium corni TaxID=536013 RepID=A0AAN9TRD9_9HEMI